MLLLYHKYRTELILMSDTKNEVAPFFGSPSHLGIAEFIIPTGSFFHAQTHVSSHIIEELSPNVRMIHLQVSKWDRDNETYRETHNEYLSVLTQQAAISRTTFSTNSPARL